jgi:hypothetical protein
MATIPKLALIPSGYKAGKVYSVLPTTGVGDFDFTRASSATRVNSSGLIETVATGIPRLNYPLIDGVVNGCPSQLLEPASTNLVDYSEDFSNAYWTKLSSTITSNSVVSPNGTLNSDSFTQSGGTSEHSFYNTINTINGQTYASSIFVKHDNWQYFQFRLRSGGFGGEIGVVYDSINKVITTSAGNLISSNVIVFPDNWVKIEITATATSSSGFAGIVFAYNNSAYIFDDVDGVPNSGANVYIFGAQLEQQSYPTSYIPTSGSAVTRVAETANGSGDANTFNDSEGVLMYQIKPSALDSTHKRITLSDSTSTNRIILGFDSSNNVNATIYNGSNQAILGGNYIGKDKMSKYALKYKENDFALWLNGFEVNSKTSGITYPSGTLNQFRFEDGDGGLDFYGSVKQLQYFDSALNDSELETLTSWTSFTEMANGQTYSIK